MPAADWVRLATRLIIEETLEPENRDASGQGDYERGGDPGSGCCNGNRTGRIKTAEGLLKSTAILD